MARIQFLLILKSHTCGATYISELLESCDLVQGIEEGFDNNISPVVVVDEDDFEDLTNAMSLRLLLLLKKGGRNIYKKYACLFTQMILL